MADPFDWQNSLAAGGDILEGVGGLISGLDENAAFGYNADILNQQADQVMTAEALKEYEFGKQEDVFIGNQKAQYAAAGVTMSGSPTDALLNSMTNFELDKQVMNYNAQVKAAGLRSEANVNKFYGREAANAGVAKLGSSLLTAGQTFL